MRGHAAVGYVSPIKMTSVHSELLANEIQMKDFKSKL